MSKATTPSFGLRRLAAATGFCLLLAILIVLAGGRGVVRAQTTEAAGGEGTDAQAAAPQSGEPTAPGEEGTAAQSESAPPEGPAAATLQAPAKAKPGRAGKGGRGGKGGKGGKAKKMKQPNIIFVETDDQSLSTVLPEAMPNLFNKLMPRGTTFSDFVVTTPLCCPSRAAVLTGEYGHNNGVLRNVYNDLKQKRNVLPAWLQRAGYNTAHVGKFLNSYEQGELGPAAVAPGWDLWFTELEKRRYYNWKASKNGKVRHYGTDDSDHVTKVTTGFATRWTKRLVKKKDPFYMQVDYYAPHTSTGRDTRCASAPVPEPQDEGRFAGYPLPMPPSYNEADVSDKPYTAQNRPPLNADDEAAITRRFRCTLESVYGIDRGIGKMIKELKRKRELNDTVFIFSSDNGFFYGEHRIAKGKPDPFEENIHMPLTIAVPPRFRDRARSLPTSSAPVANIDLAPTIMDLADSPPCRTKRICRTMDGRSLMPIMDGSGGFPNPRGIGIELYDCQYRGARFDGRILLQRYAETPYGCDKQYTEYYDLRNDPYQLENLFPAQPGSADAEGIDRLEQMTEDLRTCQGVEGRDPAPPPNRQYCP